MSHFGLLGAEIVTNRSLHATIIFVCGLEMRIQKHLFVDELLYCHMYRLVNISFHSTTGNAKPVTINFGFHLLPMHHSKLSLDTPQL